MKLMKRLDLCLLFTFLAGVAIAADQPARREWKVGDVKREALVYAPATAKEKAAPVVFAWHGHGGNMQNSARSFHYHETWPEAIVVYPQGLNTPGRLTDPEGKKPGWQGRLGDQDDRDLKFFDAVLAGLKKDYKVDESRIYSTGHSNGGGFTYLLWATRGEVFAAFAPSAAAASNRRPTLPKPVVHVGAENDPLVKFAWQKATLEGVKKLNQCGEGKPWKDEKGCTEFESEAGAPLVIYLHDGGHKFPQEAPAIIVKFFKKHAKKPMPVKE